MTIISLARRFLPTRILTPTEAIRDQINRIDWTRPSEDIASMLIEAGFRLRDHAAARWMEKKHVA